MNSYFKSLVLSQTLSKDINMQVANWTNMNTFIICILDKKKQGSNWICGDMDQT